MKYVKKYHINANYLKLKLFSASLS